MFHRDPPGHRGSPVVTDEMEAINVHLVGEREDVGHQFWSAVRPARRGPRARRVSTLIRSQHVVSRSCELRHHVTPGRRRLRKAVQENDRSACDGTLFAYVEDQPIAAERAQHRAS